MLKKEIPIQSSYEEVIIMIIFGVLGYLMEKFEYEPVPLIFAFILTPIIERSFRQSLTISHGDFLIFFKPPIALIFMIIGFILLALLIFPYIKKRGKI